MTSNNHFEKTVHMYTLNLSTLNTVTQEKQVTVMRWSRKKQRSTKAIFNANSGKALITLYDIRCGVTST